MKNKKHIGKYDEALKRKILEAGAKYAEEKAKPVEAFLSNPKNVKDIKSLLSKLNR